MIHADCFYGGDGRCAVVMDRGCRDREAEASTLGAPKHQHDYRDPAETQIDDDHAPLLILLLLIPPPSSQHPLLHPRSTSSDHRRRASLGASLQIGMPDRKLTTCGTARRKEYAQEKQLFTMADDELRWY